MDRRVAGLAAGTSAVLAVCALAALDPGLVRLADAALVAAGLGCAGFVWWTGGRHSTGLRGWRLIALGPVFTASGALAALVMDDADPVRLVVVRLAPMVPAYLLSIIGGLTLVERGRLRGRGGRMALELGLFSTACLVAVQFLYAGPDARWSDVPVGQALVLAAGAVTTSAYMVATLTVLGGIEARRKRAALLLVISAISLTIGRGLGTSGLLAGAGGIDSLGRFLVVAGLAVTVAAALADPGPSTTGHSAPRSGRSTELVHVLPHLAMVVAMTAVGVDALLGRPPTALTVLGALLCVLLAATHRWVCVRAEQRTGARLRRSEAYFRSLVSASGDAVVLLDRDLRVTWASTALDHLLGTPADALAGRPLTEAVHPEDADRVAAALLAWPDAADGDGAEGLLVLRLQDADGGWRRLEAAVSDLRADPVVRSVVLHCRDVTERYDREQELLSIAYTDPCTGMPNRAGLLRAVEGLLDEPGDSTDDRIALLLIQLVGMAEAREHARLETVNTVVSEIGRRLRATVRADDLVARIGGEMFGVLAYETGTEADQLADRCLAVVEQPIVTADGVVDLTAVIGLAPLRSDDAVGNLLGRAELALSAASAAGPGTAVRYRPALGEAALRRERLRRDLPDARSRGELALFLQPIVSLQEQRVTGLEARLRWRHPELGDIPAAEFLPIAERSGLVAELQRFALEEAMQAAAEQPSTGAPLRLGVDVPTAWAAGGTLLGDVEAALQRTGFGAERLVLELTEDTVLSGDERVRLDLTALRLMGVHIALDDFGAGPASLASLTRLPIDILKLDRSFVGLVDRDPQRRALCESVVGIGRALGLDVVAEGVETPAQLAALQAAGAGFAQGFLISRALPPADLARTLRARAGVLWPGLVGSR